jgi:2-polyprenyl-3-methyl-5-hydroxy-6-metoxy-1,4-benzoquinol methylase
MLACDVALGTRGEERLSVGRNRRASGPDASIPGDYQYVALTEGSRIQRFWHWGKLQLARELLQDKSAGRVLDLGCGSGNLVYELAQSGNRVVGFDTNRVAVRFARERCCGLPAMFLVGDAMQLPFRADLFDVITMVEVIEHLSEKTTKQMLGELHRVTRPGGWVFVTCPNRKSLWPLIERLLDAFRLVPRLRGEQHRQEFSIEELENVLAGAGFDVLRSGSFYMLAPFAAAVSWRLAQRLLRREFASSRKFGNLIYCVAQRPD